MKPPLLIVHDEPAALAQLRWLLAPYYEIATATDRPAALDAFRATKPFVVMLSLALGSAAAPKEGLALLAELLGLDPQLKVVAIAGRGDRELATQAVSSGAYDFVGTPVNADEIKLVLRRTFHVARLEHEFREMRTRLQFESFEGLLGSSPAMQIVFESIRKVATTDVPVLLLGESGTGKEMAARAIHQRSLRGAGPFVPIDCSAITESLFESELFGHEQGVFAGARAAHKGRVELAQGGTLFLDEISRLSPGVQVKLLRFLQDQSIERIGGHESIPVDCRVIAATRTDIESSLSDGNFREDLFYRLAVVQITIPPLRNRGDDLLLLTSYFLRQLPGPHGNPSPVLSTDALRALQHHSWPGNVRELQNRLRRAAIMCDGHEITPSDLELKAPEESVPQDSSLRSGRERVEREMVRRALRRNAGNITAAAAELGISRPTLYELMSKLGVPRLP